ncbi:MAG: ferric reductase-like transmembrane domain-containing protein [Saprospiraceae bacterium]|nr:ferric reductase-like transmembrane domain-containing protein [Saprospiraceae bacterium]
MSNTYSSVGWNNFKKSYDKIMLLGIGLIVSSFIGLQLVLDSNITIETLIIRTTSLTAVFLLHFILIIGPLSRINPAFLPLLYNRRHLGVTMFVFAAIHSIFCMIQFHALGNVNPIESIFLSNTKYLSISQFPFQVFGFFAFIIFFLMAATSHDFWLKNLSPKIWKALHMMVYIAYGLVVLHIALGILQYEDKLVYWILLIVSFGTVAGLHLWAGIKAFRWIRSQNKFLVENGFAEVCTVDEIPTDCAKTVFINGQNIAIFKYDNKLSAVNNVCRHQMGPIGEGKIIDGCITCPWHGYQYLPENGQSPPPFTEKLETYEVKLIKDIVWINPNPKPEGTFIEPVKIIQ